MARVAPEKIVRDIQECIVELCKNFLECGIPINDDDTHLHRFCFKLEYLLQNGMKEHTNLLGTRKDYWDYFCRCLTTKRTEIHDGLKFVKSISELKTSLGKGRAFIRFCLMQQCLADSLQCCFMNRKVTSNWYNESSILMNEAQLSFLISTLYELNEIQFDLSPRGHDLDVSWPTFARKLFGTPYVWQPPSRSVSISSLVSCTSQNEPPVAQHFTNENQNINEMEELKIELSSMESTIEQLKQQLQDLERKEEESRLLANDKERELLQLSSTLEKERKSHVFNVNSLEEEITRLNQNWQHEKTELMEKLSNSLEHSNKLQEIVLEYNSKEENCIRNCDELVIRISNLEKENFELLSQSQQLEQELKEHKETICQLKKNTNDFEQIISELKNENKMFKIKIKEQNAIIESQFDVTQTKPFKDLKKKYQSAEAALITARSEVKDLQRSLEKSEELNQLTTKLANTLETENLKLWEKIKTSEDNTKHIGNDDYEKINNDLKSENAAIRTELENVVKSKNKIEEDLKAAEKLPEKLLSVIEKITSSPEIKYEELSDLYKFDSDDNKLKEKICIILQIMQRSYMNHFENPSASLEKPTVPVDIEEELINLCRKQSLKIEELHKEFDACLQETLKLNCQMCILKDTLHLNDDRIHLEYLQDECTFIEESEKMDTSKNNDNIFNSSNISLWEMKNNVIKLNKLTDKTQKLFRDLEAFRGLNHRLISKVQEQERKLSGITQELETTQKLVTSLKLEHNKLQTTEAITRYELKEKRKLLSKLRTQLESTKEECNLMRKNCSDSEAEWQSLRDEFAKRHKQASEESGFVDDNKNAIDSENDNQDIILITADTNSTSSPIDAHNSEETGVVECFESLAPECEGAEGFVTEKQEEEVKEKPKSRLERLEEEFQLVHKNIMQNVSRSAHLEQRVRYLNTKQHNNASNNCLGENSGVQEDCMCNSVDSQEQKLVDNESSLKLVPNPSHQILAISPVLDRTNEILEEVTVDFSNNSSEMSEDIEPNSTNIYEPSSGSLCDLSDLDDETSATQEFGPTVPNLRRKVLDSVVDRLRNERTRHESAESELRLQLESLKDSNYNLRREVEKLEQEKTDLVTKEIDFRKRSEYIFRKEKENFHDVSNEKCNLEKKIAELTENLRKSVDKINKLEEENQGNNEELKKIQKLKEEEISALQFQLGTEALKYERALKVEELQLSLSTRDEECTKMNEDYKKMLMELDKEKSNSNQYKIELAELKLQKDQSTAELGQLRSDNAELRKKVIKLIKEKDMLWKHSEKLAHHQKIQVTDRWMEDTETNNCLGCKVTFSLMIRKHHCRLCGRIFCHNCANHWLLTASSRREARVCSECYIQHVELQSECRSSVPSVTEDSEDEELDTNNSFCDSTITDRMAMSGDSTFDSDNLSAAIDTTSTSSLPTCSPKSPTILISDTLPMYGSVPNLPSLCANKWSSHDNQLMQKRGMSLQDEFDVISDEEIASSLSLCNPYIQTSNTSRKGESRLHTTITRTATDIKAAGPQGIKGELWVNAGTQYGVPVICNLVGCVLQWEFSTEPKRIGFSVVYNQSKENHQDKLDTRPVVRMVHVNSSQCPFEGQATMMEPGVYTLIFDNRFSRVAAKKVKYFLRVENNERDNTPNNPET